MSIMLEQKIKNHKAKIAVIGLGYVGLPLAVAFAQKGFRVFGIDTSQQRIERIQQKKSYIADVTHRQIARLMYSGHLVVALDFDLMREADVVIICVPTPLKRKYTPDISFMVKAVRSITPYIRSQTLVVLESTTYPGTTQELIKPELEKSGLSAGRDFYLAFSPERIDPGNSHFKVTQIPKVVGGLTQRCGKLTQMLYEQIIAHVYAVSSPKVAEMTKLLENSFRIVNIGWINEVAQMCHKLGIDVWEVIQAAKTKPFGFMPFYPGLGVGGHCIPEDPLYLYWKAKRYGFNSQFIKLSADINAHMPHYCLRRLQGMLPKSLAHSKILVVGVTYKKDVADLRKSPSLKLIELLKAQSQVDYFDPMVPYLKLGDIDLMPVALTPKMLKKYDAIVIAVDHTKVDYALILKHAKLIFDIKNIYKDTRSKKVVKL